MAVLKASPNEYSESEKRTLEDVKQSTKAEKERYANYGSATEVRRMFGDDLSSEPPKTVQRELERLNLPTLPDSA